MSVTAIPEWLFQQTADDLTSLAHALQEAGSRPERSPCERIARDISTIRKAVGHLSQDLRYAGEFLSGTIQTRGGAR